VDWTLSNGELAFRPNSKDSARGQLAVAASSSSSHSIAGVSGTALVDHSPRRHEEHDLTDGFHVYRDDSDAAAKIRFAPTSGGERKLLCS